MNTTYPVTWVCRRCEVSGRSCLPATCWNCDEPDHVVMLSRNLIVDVYSRVVNDGMYWSPSIQRGPHR